MKILTNSDNNLQKMQYQLNPQVKLGIRFSYRLMYPKDSKFDK